MANIGKWYSKTIHFNEEGEEISASTAKRYYIKLSTIKYIKIDGNTGYIEYWIRYEKSKQRELF